METLYGTAERVLAPILHAWFDWDIEGLERLPRSGPVIVAANHVSYLDPFVVAYVLHERGLRGRFLAKAELFRNPVLRWVLLRLGQIPVRRATGDRRSLDAAEDEIWRGAVVVIFPEATIGPGLPLLPFKTGAARLSIATGVPVTPVVTWGGQAVFPKGAKRNLRRGSRLKALVGEPVSPGSAIADPDQVARLTAELQARLTGLVARVAEPVRRDALGGGSSH